MGDDNLGIKSDYHTQLFYTVNSTLYACLIVIQCMAFNEGSTGYDAAILNAPPIWAIGHFN